MDLDQLRTAHPEHFRMANALRVLAMDAVEAAKSGHPGMPMGMADVATVLFREHLKFDPKAPDWPDRDRFVLSAGHGSMLLYGLLHLSGYADMPLSELKNFRQLDARTAGHPEYGHAAGIETTTGPLGQGIATAVGMAMAERSMAARFGKAVDHRVWVVAGDGCLMEGISQEAISFAGHQRLNKLIVLWDDNGITIDGAVGMSDSTDQLARFRASGWETMAVDGHDPEEISRAMAKAKKSKAPVLIACKTHIGLGAPAKQGTAAAHGAPLGAEQIDAARRAYHWDHGPFDIPEDVARLWAATAERGARLRAEWETRKLAMSDRKRAEFERVLSKTPPKKLTSVVRALKKQLVEDGKSVATRKASEMALEVINPQMPETMGGSADLTGSNNTRTGDLGAFGPDNPGGRYVYYGIREHGMAAAMNGMALHGGVAPYGGTFLVFADYARGAMRLSALMRQRVVYVMTHDSIGLGEDGPTHQPVEQLASLRAIPDMLVFRPADSVETAECWELALSADRPSVLALTRQGLPVARQSHKTANLCAQGGYVLRKEENRRKVTLIATGSEVEIALKAREMLEGRGIGARVVSMPSFELFMAQDEAYRRRTLGRGGARIGVEAAIRQGWDAVLMGEGGNPAKAGFVGMEGFGASAPYKQLYDKFGITPDAVCELADRLI